MEFGVAYRLSDMGLSLEMAFKAAADFAHAGGGGEVFNLPEREPALPFHHEYGDTLFAIAANGKTFEVIEGKDRGGLYGDLRHYLQSDDFILINATTLFCEICANMGVHPLEALDAEYSVEVEE
jgi:hypothetical protein